MNQLLKIFIAFFIVTIIFTRIEKYGLPFVPSKHYYLDSHWKVTKAHSETDSKTLLQKLKPKDSVNEIARMLAGEVVSEQAKAHARELINSTSM